MLESLKMNISNLRGVIPPVPTIFDAHGNFDQEGMGRLIDQLVASDVNGFLFIGSAGEFSQMSVGMRQEVAKFCVDRVARRKPVIIGTASCSTEEVQLLNEHAATIGADAVMVVNPYYASLSDERIYGHYRQIAEHSPLPVLLYNFPALTGQDLSVELVGRLARDCPNIVGIKDTVDCMSHIRRIILEVKGMRPDFLVFSGYDEYMLDTLMLGGDGVIPATSNFAPQITCGIYKAFCDKNFVAAQDFLKRLAILSRLYSMDKPFTGLIKECIRLCGLDICTSLRAPITRPDDELIRQAREILVKAAVLADVR